MDIVSRSQWGARGPKRANDSIVRPSGVSFHWEGPPMGNYPQAAVHGYVRSFQRMHMDSNGWNDIAYNYLIDRFGGVYEGRGLRARSAANGTNAGNGSHLAVCFIFGKGDTFTSEMQQAGRDLLDWLRSQGVGNDVKDHSKFIATQCAGDAVRVWIAQGCPASGVPLTPLPNIVSVPTAPQPSVAASDWLEGVIVALPTLDLRNAASVPVRSALVDNLQGLLTGAQHGPSNPGGIDGIAGGNTLRAVKNFQAMKGLAADGIVGRDTWTALITH